MEHDTKYHTEHCRSCGKKYSFEIGQEYGDGDWAGLCRSCVGRYPPSLIKASTDPFDYALGLRTGEVIRFHTCVLGPEWVHIVTQDAYSPQPDRCALPYPMDRGVDVRLSDIAWCADAPEGS
jgi:hypothetical protein